MWLRVSAYGGPRTVTWFVPRYDPFTGTKTWDERLVPIARRISGGYAVLAPWALPWLGDLWARLRERYRDIEKPKALPALRPYQAEVLSEALKRRPPRALVALPTGAGKTVVAAHFMAAIGKPALVLAPTTALVRQWYLRLRSWGFRACQYPALCDATVATYQAMDWVRANAEKFYTLVLDEAHHAPAEKWRQSLEAWVWPAIMALTATPTRDDGNHVYLYELLGRPIRRSHRELALQGYLAPVALTRIWVEPTPVLRALARELRVAEAEASKHAPGIRARYRREAEGLKANAVISLGLAGPRTLIYVNYRSTARLLAKRLGAALLIGGMGRDAIEAELARYSKGAPLVITSAGMEGIDLPDAERLVVVSRPSARQFMQLVGRIVRPKERATVVLLAVEGLERDPLTWAERVLGENEYYYEVRNIGAHKGL